MKPHVAIFIESEIWPVYLKKLNQEKFISSTKCRITNFHKYGKCWRFLSNVFNYIDIAYPQNQETQNYLKKLGVKRINSIGNLKFIGNESDDVNIKLKYRFKKHKICIAASTHGNEELLAAKTHLLLKKRYKNLITVIIPRHINRINDIENDINKIGLKIVGIMIIKN